MLKKQIEYSTIFATNGQTYHCLLNGRQHVIFLNRQMVGHKLGEICPTLCTFLRVTLKRDKKKREIENMATNTTEVKAILRYIRIKVRRVLDQIRNTRSINYPPVRLPGLWADHQVLRSLLFANAEHNAGLNPAELKDYSSLTRSGPVLTFPARDLRQRLPDSPSRRRITVAVSPTTADA